MHTLALDLGRKHTGLAFADSRVGVALALDTIHHESDEELLTEIAMIVEQRHIATIVIGLPIMMNGEEGEEADRVRRIVHLITEAIPACAVELLDERETSKQYAKPRSSDRDAEAAVRILSTFLERL